MLDIRFIKEHQQEVAKAAQQKRVDVDVAQLVELADTRKTLQQEIDEVQKERNEIAGKMKGGAPTPDLIEQGKGLRQKLDETQKKFAQIDEEYIALLDIVPNVPTADTPVGPDESGNVVVRQVGTPPAFEFTPRDHMTLGTALDVIDTERAAKTSGSRFTFLRGELAWLEFALVQLVFSVVTNRDTLREIAATASLNVPDTPFIPVIPPVLVTPETLRRMARLEPKDERYHLAQDDMYLVGSAEHSLGAMHMDETFAEGELPLRYVGFSTSFRREAGSYGKDVKGILRVHQFDKVEFESFTAPELSLAEQDFLVAIQEHLMQALELPYQVVLVCTGDMGKPDARQIDIETWLPGQDRYRETHSADLMTDYQSRRLKIKLKRDDGSSEFVHMNDATAFAIGRMLIAILENNQQADGSVTIPKALQQYVPFTEIKAKV